MYTYISTQGQENRGICSVVTEVGLRIMIKIRQDLYPVEKKPTS